VGNPDGVLCNLTVVERHLEKVDTFRRSFYKANMYLVPQFRQSYLALLLFFKVQIGEGKILSFTMRKIPNLCAILAFCAGASSTGLGFSNTTSPITTAPSATGACCFVVQDTVSEVYWERLRTRTTYYVINVTSIVRLLPHALT